MICFQTKKGKRTFIIDNKYYKIHNQEQFKVLLFLFNHFCGLKRINIKNLKVIFYGIFHMLLRYKNYLIKITYNDMTNIDEQFMLSQKTPSFGMIYDIFIIPDTNTKIIMLEYISNLLEKSTILNQKSPFIFLYSLTIDYLKGLSVLHNSEYIHSSIKPIHLMVSFSEDISKKYQGKLIGLDDIIKTDKNVLLYHNTSGAINYLAPERYEYFEKNGFFGNTSFQSDIWELFYSILTIIDVIIVDEFFDLLYNNFNILESYLLNKIVKVFHIEWNNPILRLVDKYIKTIVRGLRLKDRPRVDWYIEQLIGYKNIIDK